MVSKIYIGTVVGSEIAVNRNGENDVRILSAEISSADDVQSVELISQNGEQTNPNDDSGVVILELGPSWKIAIATRDNVEPDSGLQRGEKIIYSLDSSNQIKAKIYLKEDGTVVLNDGTDWAVQFTEMKSAFDQLKSDFNSFISIFNAHVHPGVLSGGASTSPTATSGSTSSADMANAKVSTVQVP
jgi:phage gp45-like